MTAGLLAHALKRRVGAFAAIALATAGAGLVSGVLGRDLGLAGRYFAEPGPGRVPVVESRDGVIGKDLVRRRSARVPGEFLLVTWDGFLSVVVEGDREFALEAAGYAELAIDGRTVTVTGPAGSGAQPGRVALGAGSHVIALRYETPTRPPAVDLLWRRPGRPFAPIPAGALSVRPMSITRTRVVSWLPAIRAVLAVAWQVLLAGFLVSRLVGPGRRILAPAWREFWRDRAASAPVVLAIAISALGIWWGLPSQRGWAPDEIVPANVLNGLRLGYSGGWHEIYPAWAFILPGLLSLPVVGAGRLAGVPIDGLGMAAALFAIVRATSLLAAAGTVWFVQATARALAGRTAGLLAAAVVSVMPTMAYYGKLGNVEAPYLFWFAASLFFLVGAARHEDGGALRLFAVTAALALCTKDQAAAFYVLPALALAVPRARRWFAEGAGTMIGAGLRGRDLVSAAAMAAAVFAVGHNLPFNWEGFVAHVRFITGDASVPYRMWPMTVSGQAAMALEATRQMAWLLGPPVAVLLPFAVVHEAVGARGRRLALLALPVASYALFFCVVAGYLYDRFLMGPAFVVAMVFGLAGAGLLDRLGGRSRRAALIIVWVGTAYLVARALSIDLLMVTDSRYAAERWLATAVSDPALVAGVGPRETLPRYERQPYVPTAAHPEVLVQTSREFFVLDAGYLGRFGPERPEHAFYRELSGGAGGYRLAFRAGPRWPWLPLMWERPFRNRVAWMSNLTKVSPVVEIYRRVDHPRAGAPISTTRPGAGAGSAAPGSPAAVRGGQ